MSKGLVLLHSLGIGRESRGGYPLVRTGPFFLLWGPKMFSLRDWCISHAKEDCVSLVQRAGYQHFFFFLFFFCQTTQYVRTNIVHSQRMHIFPLMLLVSPLYDICSPPFKPFRICKRRKFELNAQRENRGSRVSPSLYSRIAGLKRFMPPMKSEDLEIWVIPMPNEPWRWAK